MRAGSILICIMAATFILQIALTINIVLLNKRVYSLEYLILGAVQQKVLEGE